MNHNQSTATYPPLPQSTVPNAYVAPPPPVGYPTMDAHAPTYPQKVETQSRGDGFWKGCCAALCCCCLLDACF